MQKSILILVISLVLSEFSKAQCPPPSFTLPDSICSGVAFQINNTPVPGFEYDWDFCIGELKNPPAGQNLGNTSLVAPYVVKSIIDNGNRYLFITDRTSNSLRRYDFGSSYDNTPVHYSYGNPSNLLSAPIGLEMFNENGTWFVFITGTGNTNLTRLNLGTDISQNNVAGVNISAVGLNTSRNLKAISDGTNYYLFSTNSANNTLTRIDFGNSFANAPSNFINFSDPNYAGGIGIDIVYDCDIDKYIGFYANNTLSRIQKLDFGNSLTNTPVFLSPILTPNATTGIQIMRDGLNWHLLGYFTAGSVGGKLQNYSFGNSLLNTPVSLFYDTVGAVPSAYSFSIINDSSTFYGFANSINPPSISRIKWPQQCGSTPAYSNDPNGTSVALTGFGYYPFSMTATNQTGTQYTYVDSIYLSPAPTTDFSSSPGCEGFPVQFNDSSTIGAGSIVSWLWDFGDGSPPSTLQDPVHNFAGTGTFTVSLTTESAAGCENIYSTNVTISPNPVADFSFLNNQCQNTEVLFNDLSQSSGGTTVVNWVWDFGDGTIPDSIQSPLHTFLNTGTYTVQLNIETDAGCTDSILQDITIIPSPEASFAISSTCVGDSVSFTNLTSIQGGGSIFYDWDLGDGANSTQINPVHQYSAIAGNYDVTLIATSTNGCTDTIIENIRIANRPVPQFSWTPLIVCQGNQVNFINTSTGTGGDTISGFLWDFGSLDSSFLENPVYAFPDTGFYNVTLIATSPTDCDSAITEQVYVIPSPTASFTASNVCLNGTTSFNPLVTTPPGTIVDSIVWTFGDGTVLNTLTSPVHLYTTPGKFGVTMTVYNDLTCVGFFTDSVEVYPLPTANFTIPLICTGTSSEFDGTLSSVVNDTITGWLWDFAGLGNSSDSIAQFVIQIPGIYDVTLIVSTIHGCTDTITQSVTAIQSPDFTITYNEPCLGNSTSFTYVSNIIPVPPSNLLWDFGDGTLSSLLSPSHFYSSSDSFTVSLTVLNPNTGCSGTYTNQVYVKPIPVPGFSATDNCEGQPVQFNDTSQIMNGSIVLWDWEFGPLGISNIQNPVITPNISGTFNVVLTVTSDEGCASSVSDTLYVYARPEAVFIPDPTFGSPPLPVTFVNSTIGGSIYLWEFGDGSTGTGTNPLHIYPDTGTYFVTLYATSTEGCLDTAYGFVSVLIPYLDIAVTNIYTTTENNKLKLSAQLTNQGNLVITEFNIRGSIENGSIINEKWEGVMIPGSSFLYEFVSSYEISDSYSLGFFCIEALDPNNATDQNLSNNKKCSVIENGFEIFSVFPNPFSSELVLNFNLSTEGLYEISLYDEAGKQVIDRKSILGLEGFNSTKLNTYHLSKGYYTVVLQFRDEKRSYKVLKVEHDR